MDPNLCESGQCNEQDKESGKKKNIVTPLVASVSGVVLLLVVVAAILWTLKRRKLKGDAYKDIFIDDLSKRFNRNLLVFETVASWYLTALIVDKDQSQIAPQHTEQDDLLLPFRKQIYSYSDILKITNNFNTTLGRGGFGTVYLGHIDDTPVAVKMLSSSSVKGFQQFQAEASFSITLHLDFYHRNKNIWLNMV